MSILPDQDQADEALRSRSAERTYEQLLVADRLTTAELDYLIGGIWSGAEFPDRHLDRDTWRWLFKVAGFTIDGTSAERPAEPIVLWRGSVPERRTDWSWSTNRSIAEGYANGTAARRPTGRLYTVLAPPESLLCANNCRGEDEIVVDTRGLQIEVLR
ncbi:hypothetical protein [Streptomyces sp. Amel2xC10]|uniref:hypothetical protein n=1 Tax=Streptomyces sp. Amel2xC10 TaxID=1305826 RepID=UPI000A08AA0F|nr:hypothetical protein [Streptomyces sp. Amel2xC10]SMF64527.1 hypothetical protein SAMN02745830_05009 [Streptomyces sp. Amel2xC10]